MQMISSSADILFVFDEEDDENTLKPTYLEDVIVDEIKKLDINSNTMRTEVLVPISSYLKCFLFQILSKSIWPVQRQDRVWRGEPHAHLWVPGWEKTCVS